MLFAPVSSILHSMGIRLRRYLDNWLIQSSSREAVLRDLRVVLDLCTELGIVVNPVKSNFVPSQRVLYLGTVLDSRTLVASPSPDRIARLLSLGKGFLSSVQQPAACWQSLLGTLSSLTHLVLVSYSETFTILDCQTSVFVKVPDHVAVPVCVAVPSGMR